MSLLGQHLDEGEVAVGKELSNQFLSAACGTVRARRHASRFAACNSATSSSSRCCAFCALLMSSSDLRACCGTSHNWAEKTRAGVGERLEVAAGDAHGAQSADELHAHALLHLLGLAQQDRANLPGAADVGSAAGVQVEVAECR